MSRKTAKLLAACYLTALLVWVLVVAGGLVQTAWYRNKGLCRNTTLTLEDMTLTAIKHYDNDDAPQETWYVSTDSDPQMLWEEERYLNRVVLKIEHSKPGNGVELYYRLQGQEDFSLQQVVYAHRNKEGWYEFDLRGKMVSAIRIDPDSQGGIPTRFDGVELEAPWPLWQRCLPNPGQAVLLVCLPLVAGAGIAQLLRWKNNEE